MIVAVRSSITKQFPPIFNISRRMAFPGLVSRALSVCLPAPGLLRKGLCSYHRAALRSVSFCSVRSTIAATSLHNFADESSSGHLSSVSRSWSSKPVAVRHLRHRSTTAAPDVFPKRVTRRTKKKEIEHRSHVSIYLMIFIITQFLYRTYCCLFMSTFYLLYFFSYTECILFQNLRNLDRSERNAPRSFSPDWI